jgi:hypothetical protein
MTDIRETLGSSLRTRVQDQIINDAEAREILRDNRIELGIDDPRSAVQFVTEVLVWMEAVAIEKGEAALAHEQARAECAGHAALSPTTQADNLLVNESPRLVHFVQ